MTASTQEERCERCNRPLQDNAGAVQRLTRVTYKGRKALFCDSCGAAMEAAGHELTDHEVIGEIEEAEEEDGVEEEEESGGGVANASGEGEWVHKGGGYYENTLTNEVRRGRP